MRTHLHQSALGDVLVAAFDEAHVLLRQPLPISKSPPTRFAKPGNVR